MQYSPYNHKLYQKDKNKNKKNDSSFFPHRTASINVVPCMFCPDSIDVGNVGDVERGELLDEHNCRHEHLTFACMICMDKHTFGISRMFVYKPTIVKHLKKAHRRVWMMYYVSEIFVIVNYSFIYKWFHSY